MKILWTSALQVLAMAPTHGARAHGPAQYVKLRETLAVRDKLSFDRDAFEVRRNGEPVDLEPQAVTLAAYLIEHRHRLISKEELLDEIWGDRFVSESALTTRIKQIRRELGDDGTEQRVVKTVYGKGYRFVGEVELTGSPAHGDELASVVADPASADAPSHNLPRLRSGVIGRERELAAATDAVTRNRLTTLVGVGGVGKTTLAIATGHAMLASYPHGVWFVDLVPVSDGDQVPLALAKAAGLSLRTGPVLDQIVGVIDRRDMLFVIDNCEHVHDAVASTVDQLLDRTTNPRFLLTSREPVGLLDEARMIVDTLSTSEPDGPAVALLEACVSRFGVTDFDRAVADEICRELDGLPLAIELAAAQLRHLSFGELAARLDDRFDLLVSPAHHRHANLVAVLDGSWAAISNTERELLRQLAVCPAPLKLDDLIGIMDAPEYETVAALGRLVDCSLLGRSADHDGAYRMLETVRVYAMADDPRSESARRDRLADWCLSRVGTDTLTHALDFGLVGWCRTHHDLLDAAEVHLESDRAAEAGLLVAAQGLTLHLDDGSRAAAVLGRIDRHLDRIDDPHLRAQLHIAGAYGAMAARDPQVLAAHGAAAVRAARSAQDPSLLAIALVLESWSHIREPVRAIALVTEAAEAAETAADRRTFDLAEGYRAWHLAMMRHYDEAIQVARDVVDRSPAEPGYDTLCAAVALTSCLAPSDPQAALHIYATSLAGSDFSTMMVANQLLLASAHAADGDAVATARIVMSVVRRLEHAGAHALPDALVPIAMLAAAVGDDERAVAYLSAVRRSRRPTQSLQVTCLYQQLRSRFDRGSGIADDTRTGSSDEIAVDALGWIGTLAGSS